MSKKKVAFICVHNSCRSQIAEALGKHLASDVFESYSAGTETKPQINQDAVRIMKELYGIDMEKTQYSKLISDIPAPDIAISMGCNVGCPFIGRAFDDNWGLEDPTGSEDQVFVEIIREIEKRILQLKQSLISRVLDRSATPVYGWKCSSPQPERKCCARYESVFPPVGRGTDPNRRTEESGRARRASDRVEDRP